jgi:uncharacterized membrane protein
MWSIRYIAYHTGVRGGRNFGGACNTPPFRPEYPFASRQRLVMIGGENMDRRTLSIALAGSLASALALAAIPAKAQETEKCYGVALKGQNDCKAGMHDCKGMSTADYDGESFKLVPKGTCTSMETPKGKGMLEPMKS